MSRVFTIVVILLLMAVVAFVPQIGMEVPPGGPTGRTVTIAGMEFVELGVSRVPCWRYQHSWEGNPRLTTELVATNAPVWIARESLPDEVWAACRSADIDGLSHDYSSIPTRWKLLPQWFGQHEGESFRWSSPEETVCAFRYGALWGKDTGEDLSARPVWRDLGAVNAGEEATAVLDCYLVGRGWQGLGKDGVLDRLRTCWGGTTVPAVHRLVWIPPKDCK